MKRINKYQSWVYENFNKLSNYIDCLPNISVFNNDIFFKHFSLIGKIYKYHDFKKFLNIYGISNIKNYIISEPKHTLYILINKKIFILDYRYQQVAGSVDEKLQTCDFKKKQYKRLLASLNFEVEYIYILNDWFKKPEYKDVLAYIHSVGCDYYFNYIPLKRLGLPISNLD